MNDEKIVKILRSGKRDKALTRLYHYYPKVETLILSKGGQKQDANDIFQEALIIFCQRVKEDGFKLTASIDTYLYSVCRFLWKNELKKKKLPVSDSLHLEPEEESSLETYWIKENKIRKIEAVLNNLGQRCWELLKRFYYDALSMKEIAAAMNFSSEKTARNQKYKCLERAKLQLKSQSFKNEEV